MHHIIGHASHPGRGPVRAPVESYPRLPRQGWRREPDHQLTFAGQAASVGAVRDWLGLHVRRCQHSYPVALRDDLQLCASEIATNTLRHTRSGLPGGFFTALLWTCHGRAFLAVEDMGPLPGRPATVARAHPESLNDLTAETGRGLPIVAMLSGGQCGSTAPPDPRGHTVWCELLATAPAV